VIASIRRAALWISRWIDDVAAAILALGRAFRPMRKVRIAEQSDGSLLLQLVRRASFASTKGEALNIAEGHIVGALSAKTRAQVAGSQVEIVLSPRRFVFRPLELPRRASEFLEGIVRAQIDRLTPWSPAQAAFGWSAPTEIAGDRVSVTVAATAKEFVASLGRALAELRPDAIIFSTTFEGSPAKSATRIQLLEPHPEGERQARRLRQSLIAALCLVGVCAIAAFGAWGFVSGDLEVQRLDLARQLAARRVALMSGRGTGAEEATAALGRKKHETPASVIVLDTLSQALPGERRAISARMTTRRSPIGRPAIPIRRVRRRFRTCANFRSCSACPMRSSSASSPS
jgi:general secretion pathway protein L